MSARSSNPFAVGEPRSVWSRRASRFVELCDPVVEHPRAGELLEPIVSDSTADAAIDSTEALVSRGIRFNSRFGLCFLLACFYHICSFAANAVLFVLLCIRALR